MKKWIAVCMVLSVMLGLLSGCGNETAAPGETALPTETTAPAPTPIGTLYVAFGAALEITYDENGNALTITGTNELGKALAEAKQDQLNKGCVYALRSILRYAITEGLLGDAKTVTVRIGADDPLPGEDFLFTIGQDCQYLIDEEVAGIDMYCLTGDMLDEKGDLTFDTAQLLASKYLNADPSQVTGDEAPIDGLFSFTADEKSCTVDAVTGLVTGK